MYNQPHHSHNKNLPNLLTKCYIPEVLAVAKVESNESSLMPTVVPIE